MNLHPQEVLAANAKGVHKIHNLQMELKSQYIELTFPEVVKLTA